jgi:hypothetical protein
MKLKRTEEQQRERTQQCEMQSPAHPATRERAGRQQREEDRKRRRDQRRRGGVKHQT